MLKMSKWMITIYQPYDVGFELFDSKKEAVEKYQSLVNDYSSDLPRYSDIKILLSRVSEEIILEKS